MHAPRKRFSQNFLHDDNILRHIINVINPQPDDQIVEIGPGLGALTEYLVDSSATVDGIEIDNDLIDRLQEQIKSENFNLHAADALEFDISQIYSGKKLRICGNLPYNISTPLLFRLLDYIDIIQDMHFLLQNEVVERIAATPGTKSYGRMSVMLQYYCKTEALFTVPANCFHPVPKVLSAVVRLTPHPNLPFVAQDTPWLETIVRYAFGQRRKTVGNACKKLFNSTEWEHIGIDPKRRAETLSIAEFVQISNGTLNHKSQE